MKRIATLFLCATALFLGTAEAQVACTTGFFYGADGAGQNPATMLYRIDPATGAATPIGPIGFSITGLAADPTTGFLYGSTGGRTGTNVQSLVLINPQTGAGTLIGTIDTGATLHKAADISFDDTGTLYGWSETGDDPIRIDKATGDATILGPGEGSSGSGNTFVGATWYGVLDGAAGPLDTIDLATGTTTDVATLTGAPLPAYEIAAMSTSPDGTIYASNLQYVSDGGDAYLVTINPATGAVTTIGQMPDRMDAIEFCAGGQQAVAPGIPTLSGAALAGMAALLAAVGLLVARLR